MATPNLTLSADTAYFISMLARTLDAKVAETDPESGSNPSDDLAVDVLEDRPNDATREELTAAVARLNADEQLDLIALILVGRGDFSLEDWPQARAAAAEIDRARVPRFVAETPLASDYIDEALSQLGHSLEDYLETA